MKLGPLHELTFAAPPYIRDPDERIRPDLTPANCVGCPRLHPTKTNPRKMECSVFTACRAGCLIRLLDKAQAEGVTRVEPGTIERVADVVKGRVSR